jgi:hypothetical protein
MSHEIVIRVAARPLPAALVSSGEYAGLSEPGRESLLAHIRYQQEIPLKLYEWLNAGAFAGQLEPLVHRIDLDLMILLGAPKNGSAISPWVLRRSWVLHSAPLASFLKPDHIAVLNESIPAIGAPVEEIESWIRLMADGLSRLLDSFFLAETFDHAVAFMIAINVCLSEVRCGFGRIGLELPN